MGLWFCQFVGFRENWFVPILKTNPPSGVNPRVNPFFWVVKLFFLWDGKKGGKWLIVRGKLFFMGWVDDGFVGRVGRGKGDGDDRVGRENP